MKREEQRVLAGSLNVLPPTDKTPEDDAIDLLNFRVDQSGVLRSAETFQSLGNIASGDPIHTLFPLSNLGTTLYANGGGSYDVQFAPETFLIGVGTSLYLFSPFSNGGAALLLASGFDGQPLGIVVWNGFIWVMNRFQQLVLYPPALTGQNTQAPMVGDWLPGAPTAGPHVDTTGIVYNEPPADATTGPVGTYQYYVTFVAMTGLETNPGPASQSITTNPGAPSEVILTQLPISPDPTVFARRIYRTGGTLGQAYQVAQISDNTTVNGWVDWLSDLQVTELGIVMPTTNDPPPAALGVVGPYLNRLLAFNGTFDVNRAYWSQEGVPLFPGSQVTASTGNWVNVGSPDDPLYGITIHSRLAVFYKQRSIWRLQGDPDTGVLEQASATTGTVGPRAMANAGNVDYFVSMDGLFLFDLDLEHKVSQKLQPTFFSAFGWVQLGAVDLQIAAWNPYAVVCAWLNGTVLISDGYPAFLRAPGTAFLYHAETARWGRFATNFGAAITAVATLGSALYYYAGDASGNLLVSPAGNPGASNLAWQTRFLDQSLGDQPKRYVELVVDADLGGAGLTLFAFYDNGASRLPKASALIAQGVTGSGRQKFHFTLGDDGVLATNISVRIEIPNWLANPFASSGAAIYALYIYYYVEPRQTVEMVTRPFSLDPNLNTFQPRDANNVYQVKELGYDATLTGETTSQLLTDLPGNQLAVRQTDELQAVPGRRNFQLPQTQSATGYWTGRLFQVELSGTLFQLYNARILARKVGVYIEDYEALAGFLWDSWYLNFGSIQVKVFDQIKLEIETSAILIVTVSTELPGETPAVVMTQGFQGNGTRAWFTVELPAQTIGRDIRIQIGARGSWIFYRGSVSMRTTGRYLSAAPGQLDRLRTLEQDFGSERIKLCKKLELDVSVSGGGVLGFLLYTDEPGGLALRATLSVNDTGGVRQTVRVNLPPNVRGRLWRIEAFPGGTITTTAFLYAIRGWMRTVGEAENGAWAWQTFALEESETLPRWTDLPVEPTADEWTWMPVPLAEPLPSAA